VEKGGGPVPQQKPRPCFGARRSGRTALAERPGLQDETLRAAGGLQPRLAQDDLYVLRHHLPWIVEENVWQIKGRRPVTAAYGRPESTSR